MKITKSLYEIMQQDIELISSQLHSKNGSHSLWDELRVKYEIIFPDLKAILNQRDGKISAGGEFDYRPELKRVKSALLTKLLVSELDTEVNESISNDAKIVLENNFDVTLDATLNELIEESMIYIRRPDDKEKQLGLEKIWDAFERFKTHYSEDKKQSIDKILEGVSLGSNKIYDLLNEESNKLTKIGNEYQIRHFERGKEPINSIEIKEYLYFRVLSFLSLCMNFIDKE